MAKKYINGYDKFRFRILHPTGASELIYLSFKYEALKEYYEVISTLHEYIDGSAKNIAHFIKYEWRIFWTDYIEKDDLLKLAHIENAAIQGWSIYLMPHRDVPGREFRVLIIGEKREIDLFPHFGGLENTPNRGFEMSFMNADPIHEVSMVDPDLADHQTLFESAALST